MKSSSSQSLQRSLTLRGHAAAMREPGNRPEQLLWSQLRGGQLGVWFRRQVVLLGSCIVDFYCASPKLVVEVDGGYHLEPARRRADARRNRRLSKAGLRVVRVSAELVRRDTEAAVALVRAALEGGR
jgi:very-short-patch-repair endonuclease